MHKNLIIIMGDQLRYDVLGKGFTPNIDALMADGASFENAYAACPLCIPARGALMTGSYPSHNGAIVNPWGLLDERNGRTGEDFENLFQRLEQSHYAVHCGKQHFFTAPQKLEDRIDSRTRFVALERDFEAHVKEAGYAPQGGMAYKLRVPEMIDDRRTAVRYYTGAKTARYEGRFDQCFDGYVLESVLRELRQRDRTRPLFLSAMFLSPHPPLNPPEPYYSSVGAEDFVMPENVGRAGRLESPLSLYGFSGLAGIDRGREDWREPWRVYLGLVRMLDDCVGGVITALKEEGLYDESLIFFSSDHGEMLGSHCMWQKMNMFQESIKVPFCLKFPASEGIAAKRVAENVSGVDLYPTICDYMGLAMKSNVDGRSLMPVVSGGASIGREAIYCQYDGNGGLSNRMRCVLCGPDKLIVSWFKDELFIELYDTARDPQELDNLSFNPEHRGKLLHMLGLMRGYLLDFGGPALPEDAYAGFISDYSFMCAEEE